MPSENQPTGPDLIARGEYLTVAADCAACHTTKGGKPFAGGLPFKLPFGTIYSSNITPDRETGIGTWTDAEFVRAVRSGVGKHGENLYPAFPYASYALMSTDDILAIRAYINTLTPYNFTSPANDLAFPFNQRWTLRGWNLLFLPTRPMVADLERDDKWNRGAYLVDALAHCGECHSPRGLLFQPIKSKALSGGEVDGWKAWNITSDPESGLGKWSDDQIASFLSKGHAKGKGPAGGPMREAVDLSLSKLPQADIADIVAYLRTVPAVKGDPDDRSTPANDLPNGPNREAGQNSGAMIFAGACASCHGAQGDGLLNERAEIFGAHALSDPKGSNLIRVILGGSFDHIKQPGKTMPSFGKIYSDEEIAAVANYAIGRFSGKSGAVTAADVEGAR